MKRFHNIAEKNLHRTMNMHREIENEHNVSILVHHTDETCSAHDKADMACHRFNYGIY